ncbi:MAG: FKBP-type peptidyl-prolyl cis-trans isomerase [Deltaproteobacteria bacterium]|nr:FKBP-type peptidyl-prolyl cis-trans isomerase [Deltaproteobacteria bacterium]MBI4373914.1 FKBP-type peptidyl-prolyl cis-trans isomerase [Deltaproteobacteria bacterium]
MKQTLFLVSLLALTVACSKTKQPAETEPPQTTQEAALANEQSTPSGLKYVVLQEGTGASPQKGQMVTVHYTGWLADGTKFDSSVDRGTPFQFQVGTGQVIPGWDEGVSLMKIGEKRKLIIPSQLAYGEGGAGGVIPPNATLVFEVELLGVS